jgi:hypothetical protein
MILSSESTAAFHSSLIPAPRREALGPIAPRKLGAYAAAAFAKLRDIAPYAAIELILPGGSLIALVLWFYRRQRPESRIASEELTPRSPEMSASRTYGRAEGAP